MALALIASAEEVVLRQALSLGFQIHCSKPTELLEKVTVIVRSYGRKGRKG